MQTLLNPKKIYKQTEIQSRLTTGWMRLIMRVMRLMMRVREWVESVRGQSLIESKCHTFPLFSKFQAVPEFFPES